MKKLLAAAVMMVFFSIVCVCTPAFATDREPGVYLAQQSQEKAAKEDEDFEDDDEYDDDVVQINDPLYRLNHDFYLLNDGLYVVFIKPAAKAYNTG
jgi:ABC-type transporter lipoprotein component MlaA